MITVNNKYKIPSSWEELSSKQFIKIAEALSEFSIGRIQFDMLRIKIVYAVVDGLKVDPKNEILCENVYRLSERLTFPYKYVYDKRYKQLSPTLQKQLEKNLAAQLDNSDPEVRVAHKMTPKVDIDLCISQQLIPKLGSTKIGYTFSSSNGIIDTNLTAEQYIDANNLIREMRKEHDFVLNTLVDVLYPGHSKKSIPYADKIAVYYNYLGIASYISQLPKYDLLFNKESSSQNSEKASPLGAEGNLYFISEKGYGDHKSICKLSVFVYLDILLKQTIDSILSLHSYQVKPSEIANKLNLSIQQVNTII